MTQPVFMYRHSDKENNRIDGHLTVTKDQLIDLLSAFDATHVDSPVPGITYHHNARGETFYVTQSGVRGARRLI